jgi:hypothetical protein
MLEVENLWNCLPDVDSLRTRTPMEPLAGHPIYEKVISIVPPYEGGSINPEERARRTGVFSQAARHRVTGQLVTITVRLMIS